MEPIGSKPLQELIENCSKVGSHCLVLFNDDVNQFDFVVDTLVEVCKHSLYQAEQCTLIAHHKGKCDVRIGSHAQLREMRAELLNRGLQSRIDPVE